MGSRQTRIETKLAKRHLQDGTLVLYDVSSSYYTGHHAGLVQFGYNRDGKKGFPQIVYGLLCNAEGCPVAIEVFQGNTADPNTLASQIEKLRQRFGVTRVVLVGDRGMITSKRIDESLRDVEGLDWITALRADSIQKLASQGLIQPSLFDKRDLVEISSPDFPGRAAGRLPQSAVGRRTCPQAAGIVGGNGKEIGGNRRCHASQSAAAAEQRPDRHYAWARCSITTRLANTSFWRSRNRSSPIVATRRGLRKRRRWMACT